jgi:photosystem II stability/assembly factor-like uncharacterized protein
MSIRHSFALVLFVPLALFAQAKPAAKPAATPAMPDSLIFGNGLKARSIGPGLMGGRVSALAFDPHDPYTYYVGLATGGVMRTDDNGQTFSGIFDKEASASIGDIALSLSDSSVIWVATGEANDRNSTGWGSGVYRSTDGGGTWTFAGLKDSKSIARIIVHPTDPKTAWAAVSGNLWAESAERGIYKTTDGGANWTKVLSAPKPFDTKVGGGDLAIDPSNPNILYAALYARIRKPWSFISGADYTDGKDVGGIFKSTDGGATWTKLASGLPGRTQRIGLSVFAKDPKIVYAEVQSDLGGSGDLDAPLSKSGGVFRSEDKGEHWTRMSRLNPRPFYFSQIRVDPANDQLVYVLGFMVHVSEDGGKTWREDRFKNVHADNHALIIDPRNTAHLVLGTDGGIYQSFDRASAWQHVRNVPAGEYYRINVDMGSPYRICGGLQDNESWITPSEVWSKDGITNGAGFNISGGDGAYCAFDANDPNLVYAESQGGTLFRIDLTNGFTKDLQPAPAEGRNAFRYHWVSPIVQSTHEKGLIYLAGNRVFKITEKGEKWLPISPDLSSKDYEKMTVVGSGAEEYGVVYAFAESPVKAGVLWAGTDDGKLWKTDDDGANWTELTASLPGAVKGLWISRIEASHFDEKVAYLAVDGHRTGNFGTFAYRTADGGKSWQSIAADLPADQPVKVIRESSKNANLLFAGTEFALWVSLDRGAHWQKFGGLPTVAVDDILLHPRERDLVIATHGRSLFIVDDVRSLEEFTPAVAAEDAHFFAPRAAFGRYPLPGWVSSDGNTVYRGTNPPEGATLDYYIKKFTGDNVKISITNAAGRTVANLSAPGTPGFGRVIWNLRPTQDVLTEYGGEGGDKFLPSGEYTATLSYGKIKIKQTITVTIAPGIDTR